MLVHTLIKTNTTLLLFSCKTVSPKNEQCKNSEFRWNYGTSKAQIDMHAKNATIN